MSGDLDPLPMPAHERRVERGRALARRSLISVGEDIRLVRVRAGMTLRELAEPTGTSAGQLSRIKRGLVPRVAYETLALMGSVVGLDVTVRAFQNGAVVRDAAQLELLRRLRQLLGPGLRMRIEVPLGSPGDIRAWDAVIDGPGGWVVVEIETRLRDIQALVRRINLKLRDGNETRFVLVVGDSRHNRHVLRTTGDALAEIVPVRHRQVAAALRSGALPARSGFLVL